MNTHDNHVTIKELTDSLANSHIEGVGNGDIMLMANSRVEKEGED